MEIQAFLYRHPFPVDWLLQDIIVLIATLIVLIAIARREQRPGILMAEAFAFVFVYAQLYENAAGVAGLYNFGRSLVMIGYVPASIPLIEMCVLLTGLWLVQKTRLPIWTWPPVIGLFGILQDLSLDPLAVRQVHPTAEGVSARWNWLFDATKDVNLLNVPVFNFPGWMLIMLYSSAAILIGRWIHRKSGYNALVGYTYPFVGMFVAFLFMGSPISRFLLWLAPFYERGDSIEWVLLGLHLAIPTLLLLFYAKRGGTPFTRQDAPLLVVPMGLHASDLLFAAMGGFTEILPVAVAATAAHAAVLYVIVRAGRRGSSAERVETGNPA